MASPLSGNRLLVVVEAARPCREMLDPESEITTGLSLLANVVELLETE